jgi:CHAT domain-containing protein/tetratricopeptide (TPR) repeat protein
VPCPPMVRSRWIVCLLLAFGLSAGPACSKPTATICDLQTDAGSPAERLRACEQHYQSTGSAKSAAKLSELLRTKGRLAWDESRYTDALDAMDQAVRYGEASRERLVLGKALRGMFTLLLELGDLEGAGRLLTEIRSALSPMDPRTQVLLAFDEGLLDEARGRPKSARSSFETVLKSSALGQVPELEWTTTMNLFALCLDGEDIPGSVDYARRVDTLFKAGPYKDRSKSRIARGLHRARLELLLSAPAKALEILTALATETPGAQMAWKLAYERGRALRALGRPDAERAFEEAVTIIETMRAVEFDDFKSSVLAARRAPYLALFERHRDKNPAAALAIVEKLQGRTFLDALVSASQTDATKGARQVASRMEWLKRFYPTLRASPLLGQAAPIDALLRELNQSHMLEFFESEESLYLLLASGGRLHIRVAPRPLAEIRRLLAELVNHKSDVPAPSDAIASLSRALLPPDLELPAPGTTLDVVLSPALAKLPIAALMYRGRHLVESHAIAHAPSLTALAALRHRITRTAGRSVVLADSRSDLPGAARESENVQTLLGGPAGAERYVGPGATANRLLGAGTVPVLHLAVHSDVGTEGPFLLMHDRPVRMADVLDGGIRANLVVLATCASGVTLDPGLWGSMVSAFLARGTSTVLGTLWSIDDAASSRLVLDFYRKGGATDPAGALARVQRDWIGQQRPLSDWAAFAVSGRASL